MALSGVSLGARFSLATSRLRYCGPSDAEYLLAPAAMRGESLETAGRILLRFEALEPYLRGIARKHGMDPLDQEVVEAYWIGNDLLEDFTREDFRRILHGLQRNGLPPKAVARIDASLPERPLPHHAFHVAFVGVGAVTGRVGTTLANMDACRPSWGRVLRANSEEMMLERAPLVAVDGRLGLGPATRITSPLDPTFLPSVAPGESIALHWGWPTVRLEPPQVARLEDATRRSLEAANERLVPLRLR